MITELFNLVCICSFITTFHVLHECLVNLWLLLLITVYFYCSHNHVLVSTAIISSFP